RPFAGSRTEHLAGGPPLDPASAIAAISPAREFRMREPGRHAVFGRRFIRHLWQLIRIYWTSPDARWGTLLLLGAILLEVGAVYGNLRLSDAERRILDGLQEKQPTAFFAAMGLFAALSAGVVLVSAYRIYLRQLLEIRWRRGVTNHYVDRWMTGHA